MKIYLWDNGWRGSSLYVANSKSEAITYFKNKYGDYFKSFHGKTLEELIQEFTVFEGLLIEIEES